MTAYLSIEILDEYCIQIGVAGHRDLIKPTVRHKNFPNFFYVDLNFQADAVLRPECVEISTMSHKVKPFIVNLMTSISFECVNLVCDVQHHMQTPSQII
jgi:hypothetical protein